MIAGNSQTGGTSAVGVGVLVDGNAVGATVAEGHFVNVINAFNTSDTLGEGNGYYNNNGATLSVRYGNTREQHSGMAVDFLEVTPIESLNVDPLFRAMTGQPAFWGVQLTAESECIDSGDPALSDADGTRSDMGAYGGPAGENWGE